MNLWRIWNNRKRVLGMNERNLSYIRTYNSARAKAIADNKLRTKLVLRKAKIPTPKLIGYIKDLNELRRFNWDKLPSSFVIKPVSGLEGGGIEIFFNRDKQGNWIKADGSRYSLQDIQLLASDIIDGKFSLHNQPDMVFFEERVRMHKAFQYYTYKGVPDIRIITFNSIPIMAMLRLPTQESEGKGNLAMGALGAGIDIASGVTTSAISGKIGYIETVPGNRLSLSGIKIPFWNQILEYAVAAERATKLDFAAIDFLIDRELGPMIVELNARPGLSIQLANQDGLRWRLRKARGLKVQSPEKGVRLGKDLFGGAIEDDIERISGKRLIGIYEDITLYPYGKKDEDKAAIGTANTAVKDKAAERSSEKSKAPKEVKTKAKIDTGADSTSVDQGLLESLGYSVMIEKFNEIKAGLNLPTEIPDATTADGYAKEVTEALAAAGYPDCRCHSVRSSHGRSLRLYVPIEVELGDYRYSTHGNVYDRSQLTYKVIVGRKSLGKFLVEPGRSTPTAKTTPQ